MGHITFFCEAPHCAFRFLHDRLPLVELVSLAVATLADAAAAFIETGHGNTVMKAAMRAWQQGRQHNSFFILCCFVLSILQLQAATEYGANWAKAWHHWALFNCGVLEALHKRGEAAAAAQYVAPAVTGFFRR
jgi:hypothetical protein